MTSVTYVENCFLLFFELVEEKKISLESSDVSPIRNFVNIMSDDRPLTRSQANFVLRLLGKYQSKINHHGIDISDIIQTPLWKNPFREIDNSKSISLESNNNQITYILARFPFSFKDTFFDEFLLKDRSKAIWDHDVKSQRIKLLDINLINFVECAKKYNFIISGEILDLAERLEEYWANEESLIPHSILLDNAVVLVNASSAVMDFFNAHKKNNIYHDLILAKSMGFFLRKEPTNKIEKISAAEENKFWINSFETLIDILQSSDHFPAVVILDRASDNVSWAQHFISVYEKMNLPISDVKICYRFSNEIDDGRKFNDWVKDLDLGKNLDQGKIFICLHKPPKWMFKDNFDVKIIVTNGIYPNVNSITDSMVESFHTVLFSTDIKPSEKRNKKIVQL
jgi:hypothetical protein